MRAAGDLARSDRLAADDVQHLSQGTPCRKVPKLQGSTPQIPHASRQLPRLPAKRRWWGRPGSWSRSRRTWRWSARRRPASPWPDLQEVFKATSPKPDKASKKSKADSLDAPLNCPHRAPSPQASPKSTQTPRTQGQKPKAPKLWALGASALAPIPGSKSFQT